MWTLTITYGEYHDLKTLTHTSDHEHDRSYEVEGYWHFSATDDQGIRNWTALVKDVRSAVNIEHVEPSQETTAQNTDQVDQVDASAWSDQSMRVPPIPPWETGRGGNS